MELKSKHLQMYMRIAEAVAETSSAVRLKVGAVAVKNNMVIGTGYNGLPSGVNGECETEKRIAVPCPERWAYELTTKPEVRHAEANLLLNLARSTESSVGSVIFCTHACCKYCAMDIVDSGAEKFYYRHQYRSADGLDYLIANGVQVEKLEDCEISL